MERVLLGEGREDGDPRLDVAGEEVDEEEEDNGAEHEEELELGGEVLEHRLVVDVPGEAKHGEKDETEEAEVDREAQVVPERVVAVVVLIFSRHSKGQTDRQQRKSVCS